MTTKPEDVMPWKINGERWHLGEKGFPPGKRVQWDRSLLPRLLELLREVEPGMVIAWDARDAITIRVPGASRAWAALRTKNPVALELKLLGRRGQFNLASFEPTGAEVDLTPYKSNGEVARLSVSRLGPDQLEALRVILREHLGGFRGAFGRAAGAA
jgi:excinuclease ABC subunit A